MSHQRIAESRVSQSGKMSERTGRTEYAVEPVGVDIQRPSAWTVVICCSSPRIIASDKGFRQVNETYQTAQVEKHKDLVLDLLSDR